MLILPQRSIVLLRTEEELYLVLIETMCVQVSGIYYTPTKRKLTLTLGDIGVGNYLGLIGSLSFLVASDQGIVEEDGAAVGGGLSSSGRKCSPCPAAAGMFWPSGK